MESDVFCIKEQTNKTVFYESEHIIILYDIKPVVKGHILIIPKRHIEDTLELTNEEIYDMNSVLKKVLPRILEMYGDEHRSYNISSQIGQYSGRSVPHLHIHIIPRRKDDIYQEPMKNIFEDLRLNKTHFTYKDVEIEVKKLRKEFGYPQMKK
jgi:bis(5'-adenosyl)-triphosphatase